MRRQRKTESQLVEELKSKTDRKAGVKRTAADLGVSSQFVCEVIAGRRSITERLARAMGYRVVIEFERL